LSGDFASLEQEALLSLFRTFHIVEPMLSSVFADAKLTAAQYNVLRILKGHQSEEGMSCADVASRMLTKDSDLTRLIDKLVKAGFVKRERPEYDRRVVLISITDDGKSILFNLKPKVEQAEQSAFAHLSQRKLHQLIELLAAVRSKPST
jgi:DNA-binding MarR family transcriptional regulator